MRFLAVLPILLCAASLILSFLCLFAGSSKGFMESYDIVTLNTSRIGQNLLNDSKSSDNPFVSFVDNITNSIADEINESVNDFAKDLGLHDFYSAHLMDFCEGYYTPASMPNATVSKGEIHRNVTSCSNTTAGYNFDPRKILQRELNRTGHSDIDLEDLNWPDEIDKGLKALQIAQKATFIIYCIAIGLIGVAMIFAFVSIFFNGRLSAFINVLIDWLAFLAIGIASAIVTAVAVKASHIINKYGNDIGVSAGKGNKFLALTWVATGLMFVASIVWCFDCIVGRKNKKGPRTGPKKSYGDYENGGRF